MNVKIIFITMVLAGNLFAQEKLEGYFLARILDNTTLGELAYFTDNSRLVTKGIGYFFTEEEILEILKSDSINYSVSDIVLDPSNHLVLREIIREYFENINLASTFGFTNLFALDNTPIVSIDKKNYAIIKLEFLVNRINLRENNFKCYLEEDFGLEDYEKSYIFRRLLKIKSTENISTYIKSYKYKYEGFVYK